MKKKKEEILKYLMIIAGALLYTAGLNFFVTPMRLYSGGVMGISQLLRTLFVDKLGLSIGSFDLSGIIYYVFNIPLFIMAYKKLSKPFFFKTLLSVSVIMIAMALVPIPEPLVENKLTGCIIGGMAVGTGIGMMLRSGGSGGGFDIVGTYVAKHYQNMSVGKVALIVNVVIYVVCAILFDVETAIYSVILSAVNTITLDRVHYQNIMMQTLIITKTEDLAEHIMEKTHRGVTEWTGDGAYTNEGVHILITVVSKYEMIMVKRVVHEYDSHAFVTYTQLSSLDGNFQKRLL